MTQTNTNLLNLSDDDKDIIQHELLSNFEDVLHHFNVDLQKTDEMFIGCCPIHGGNNTTAFNMYRDSYGNWNCNTRQCENTFMATPIGFVRGMLSREKYDWEFPGDKTVSFPAALEWVYKYLDKDVPTPSENEESREKQNFINQMQTFSGKKSPKLSGISRKIAQKSLQIPSAYYINRGYSPEILEKYDVGLCDTKGKQMYNRVVVPIYDENHRIVVGCTGRIKWDQCKDCRTYHNPVLPCPPPDFRQNIIYSKWKHSKGLSTKFHLYNYWFAKTHIQETGIAILVESPGNVWRIEEAGLHMSVATFGAKLTDQQLDILDRSGAMTLIVLGDNDKAGQLYAERIIEKCGNRYNIVVPTFPGGDIADNYATDVHKLLSPIVKRYSI